MDLRSRLRPTTTFTAKWVRARRRRVTATATVALAGLVTAGLATTAVAPANADLYSDNLDLVFLMDGSGSIDSADWAMLKQGYIEALDDLTTFPRDGSISVSLVH